MMAGGLAELADDVWRGSGLQETFPRPIERVVAMRLPLTVVKVPSVGVPQVRRWLAERGLDAPLPDDARELMGCLVAHRGRGVAFVRGADPPDEQRMTVAHEVAHFILDYDRPRRRVLDALGAGAADVLDGLRAPTLAERAAALLAHVRLGPHVHLLPRARVDLDLDLDGAEDLPMEWAEARADALALELVAPREWLVERLMRCGPAPTLGVAGAAGATGTGPLDLARELGREFGLPPGVFRPLLRAAAARARRTPAIEAAVAAFNDQRAKERSSPP